MSYLNFAFLSVKKNAAAFVLAILEIAALFLAVNYSVSAIHDRKMLIAPFKKLLDENTFFVYDSQFFNTGVEQRQSRQTILDEISGDYEIYDVLSYYSSDCIILSVSDKLYSKLEMPLVSGSYKTAVGTFRTRSGERSVTTEGGTFFLNVSGILTASTYLPQMSSFNSGGLTTSDIFETSVNQPNIIITNRTAISGLEEQFSASIGFFVNIKQDREGNYQRLAKISGVLSGADIIKNSETALKEDLSGFAPVLLCVLCVVIIGILCISAIITRQNEYRNGVMWLCGYSKKQMLWAHAVNILTMLIISLVISAAVLGILKICENEIAASLNLTFANLVGSVVLSALLIGISLIIPAAKSANKSPIEYLGRAK